LGHDHFLSRLFGSKPADQTGWIDPADLAAHMSDALIVDVRGPGEFTGPLGHIDSARNIPLDTLARETDALLKHQGPIVMVCHTDRRSAAAAAHLRKAGATEVAVLRGGMVAWRAEGR
jgi:rhodanese-related sulfurtransferase